MLEQQLAGKEVVGDLSRWELPLWRAALSSVGKAGLLAAAGFATTLFVVVALLSSSIAGVWLFPLAMLAVAAGNASSKAYWGRVRAMRAENALDLPDPAFVSDKAAEGLVRRLWETRAKLYRAERRSPFATTRASSNRGHASRELERRALPLIARVEHIHLLLSDVAVDRLGAEVERLRAAAAAGAPAVAAIGAAYRKAATVAANHREVIRRLELRRAHLLAQLEYLVGSAEALPAKITDLDLARVDACDQDGDEIVVEMSPPDEPEAWLSVTAR